MKILAIGDVVGSAGLLHLQKKLWSFRTQNRIDLTVVNGENASDIRGICRDDALTLLGSGADLITLGNHAFGKKDLYSLLENEESIIRPANTPGDMPGSGYLIYRADGYNILCMNISGKMYLSEALDPFTLLDRILEREAGKYDLALLDIHAEATSEKLALARYFDGRIHIIFGTHTHVPTADTQILPHGSGYVTDLGMCGATDSIIGAVTEDVIKSFTTEEEVHFHAADGPATADGVIFDLDPSTGTIHSVTRVKF